MNMKKVLVVVAVIALAYGVSFLEKRFRASQAHETYVNGIAPDFTLPQLNGGQVTLSSYRGKVVLLDFWATWCEPCRQEIPHFVELQNKYGNSGLQIVGVSMDDGPEPVVEFYKSFKMNYPVALGNANVGTLYGGVLGLPINFIIDRDGRIRAKHIGATDLSVFDRHIQELVGTATPTR